MAEPDKFFTINEFADKLRVHAQTIRKAIKQGRIQAFRVGAGPRSQFRIPETEVVRLCELDMTKLIERIVEEKMEKK